MLLQIIWLLPKHHKEDYCKNYKYKESTNIYSMGMYIYMFIKRLDPDLELPYINTEWIRYYLGTKKVDQDILSNMGRMGHSGLPGLGLALRRLIKGQTCSRSCH